MNRRKFIRTATVASASTAVRRAMPSQQPNIVIVYTDDLGYGDLSCYGSRIATSNFDQMAADGAVFTHCVSGGAVCTPARAALMTGRYATRMGIPDVMFPGDTNGIPDSETTIAQMLKSAGYQTMCVGKWHLGSTPKYLPTNRGFDEYIGIPYSHDMTPRILLHNTQIIENPADLDTLTQRYTQWAVEFIERAKNAPFFLYLAHNAPHLPLFTSSSFRGKSALGFYGDVVWTSGL
jgi:arylsulfatase